METVETLYSYFFKALEHVVAQKGYGGKTEIAIDAGISNALVSQILSPKSKKKASLKTQKAIAKACGYKYEEFLALGRRLLKGKGAEEPPSRPPEPFPDYDKIMRLPLFDRAYAIVKKAAEANKIMQFHSALGDRRTWKRLPRPVADFMDGKITELELYEHYVEFFRQRIARLEEALLKGE